MELVVVNGSSAIARGVLSKLVKGGKYNKVKLLDFRPYRRGIVELQRELKDVEIEKKQV